VTGDDVVRVPARAGRAHAQNLLKAIATTRRSAPGVRGDLKAGIEALRRPQRRRGLAVVISDFLGPIDWERSLRAIGAHHELLAIEVLDPRDVELPPVGDVVLQDAETGALMLVDVTAAAAAPGAAPLEPIRIIDATRQAERDEKDRRDCGKSAPCAADFMQAASGTPVPVVLTRYAAQSLYAPLRTIEEVAGIVPVALPRNLTLETLLPGLAIRAKALAAWRLADHWVTAVRLTHTAQGWLTLDPRTLQGDFVAATFQHPTLGPAGESTDTTVVYIVTRGHGLAEALLPAISPIDASNNVSPSSLRDGGHDEE